MEQIKGYSVLTVGSIVAFVLLHGTGCMRRDVSTVNAPSVSTSLTHDPYGTVSNNDTDTKYQTCMERLRLFLPKSQRTSDRLFAIEQQCYYRAMGSGGGIGPLMYTSAPVDPYMTGVGGGGVSMTTSVPAPSASSSAKSNDSDKEALKAMAEELYKLATIVCEQKPEDPRCSGAEKK